MKFRIYILVFIVFGFSSLYSQSTKGVNYKISKTHIRSNTGISIYPNPVTDYFKINSSAELAKIEIYNLIGKRVKVLQNNSSGLFDVSDLRNGIYLVRVFGKRGKALKVLRLSINTESP